MRSATLAVLMAALAIGVAAAAGDPRWSPSAVIATCGPASDPHVVFPYSYPQTASGRGAILWLGAAPQLLAAPSARRSTRRRCTPTTLATTPRADLGPRRRRRAARDGDDDRRAARRGVRRSQAGPSLLGETSRRARPRHADAARRLRGARRDRERVHRRRRRRQHRGARRPSAVRAARAAPLRTSFQPPVTFSSAGSGPVTALGRSAWTSAPTRSCCGRRAARSTRAGSRTRASSIRSAVLGPAGTRRSSPPCCPTTTTRS